MNKGGWCKVKHLYTFAKEKGNFMDFIKYEINGKNVKIPTEQIKTLEEVLNLTEAEAIKTYLEDEGYIINEEQEKLTQKAKENKVTASLNAKSSKPRKKTERTRKADAVKENLIQNIADFLKSKNMLIKSYILK